ncbi:MAG: ribose 5-phosphate isomerase B [Candidatus Euphemobacter frigidus]|nr:ribose 5-phosphate isomerase B [Candidatus Euphemobacter frigidus]MDP8276499.1 ribose 5-phosphate isomerase B [Candidatus Euphemobacter frigidus]
MKKPVIVIGADHAAFGMKEYIKQLLQDMGYTVEDVGTYSRRSVDYPDYAEKVAVAVTRGRNKKGILGCGTGIGAAIAANKIPGALAALVHNPRTARLSVEHDNANILVLAGRPYSKKIVARIVRSWLTSKFQGGRHLRRVKKIRRLERSYR